METDTKPDVELQTFECCYCNEELPAEHKLDEAEDPICDDCFSEHCVICNGCETTIGEDDALIVKDNKSNVTAYCEECAKTCSDCLNPYPNDDMTEVNSGGGRRYRSEYVCQKCYDENYGLCEECSETYPIDNLFYVEHHGSYCESCYSDSFFTCDSCGETCLQSEMNIYENERGWDESLCEYCFGEKSKEMPKQYEEYNSFNIIPFNIENRIIHKLKQIAPISVKDLKTKYPRLADPAQNIIIFVKGGIITLDALSEYSKIINQEEVPVAFTAWKSHLQRSRRVDNAAKNPQLVMNIIAPASVIESMKQDGVYELFDKINSTSKSSGHPYVKDQLGWARLELHKEEKYILIDEIQTDHMNAIDRIKTETHQGKSYKSFIMESNNLTEEQFVILLQKLKSYIKNFTDIAFHAISLFAQQHGFSKLYYHTYESGKELKHNAPPKSLYEHLPKRHFFEPTDEQPFDLEGKFLAREARVKLMKRFLRLAV